jgi:hypothetical protein
MGLFFGMGEQIGRTSEQGKQKGVEDAHNTGTMHAKSTNSTAKKSEYCLEFGSGGHARRMQKEDPAVTGKSIRHALRKTSCPGCVHPPH